MFASIFGHDEKKGLSQWEILCGILTEKKQATHRELKAAGFKGTFAQACVLARENGDELKLRFPAWKDPVIMFKDRER